MAYPPSAPKVTDEVATNSIFEAKIAILQCMADLFCNSLAPDLLRGFVANPAKPTYDEMETLVDALKKILCGYTFEEKATAAVINAITKKQAADKGIDPCKVCCKQNK